MFRITTIDTDDVLVMQLEGSLSGAWAVEAGIVWRELSRRRPGAPIRVDLRGVCHVDEDGRRLMTLMHLDGAEFVAAGCEMPEIVRDISRPLDLAHPVAGGCETC
jgi:hypothetical protein